MSYDQSYMEAIAAQLEGEVEIIYKKMFGAYGVFSAGKFFAIVSGKQLFIKPTESGRAFIKDPKEMPPYEGANVYFLIEDPFANKDWLSEVVQLTVAELPKPKPRKKKK